MKDTENKKTEEETQEIAHPITFGKGVRAGNFRLYKFMASVGAKEKLACIVVSSLSQTWKVQIPSTMPMYEMIEMLYNDYASGNKRGLDVLLSNFMNCSLTARADYQYLVSCIAMLFLNPNGTVTKDGTEYSFADAVCNDIKWMVEELQVRYREDRKEDNTEEAKQQLKADETFHSMIDELNIQD